MRTRVSIVKDENMERRTERAISLLGGVDRVVDKGDRVLIKPNMVGGLPPEIGETTPPEVVRVVVELALNAGAREVLVGEGEPVVTPETLRRRFINKPLPQIHESLHERYRREVDEAGGKFIDFYESGWKTVKVPKPVYFDEIRVAKALLECDVLIGVPVLKTHHLTGLTAALKNLYGAIPPEDKRRYHLIDRVEEAIVDINQVRSSDMVIVDGTRTILHWGIIDEYLETHRLNLTIAGYDPVAVDTISAMVLGLNPRTLRFLSWAEERGVGTSNPNEIEVLGVPVEKACKGRMMTSVEYINRKLSHIHLVNRGACTGCFGRIATALYKAKDEGVDGDIYILMGPGVKPQNGGGTTILCGNCAAPTFYNKLKGIFIPGCPPDLKLFLKQLRRFNVTV